MGVIVMSSEDVADRHKKQLSVMRGWLEGKGYYSAAEALELVRGLEVGLRKDGKTPKFHHQLSVARLISTLAPHLTYPEETITSAFLHDLLEDHGDEWTRGMVEDRFGGLVANAVWRLSKKSAGMVKTYDRYFDDMGACPIASVVKLADRAHNLHTMQGVFDYEKQAAYVNEVSLWFHPMIKRARRLFPRQYPAYENLKLFLLGQMTLIKQIHLAAQHQQAKGTPECE